MEDAKSQLVDKLKSANNILVTVSRDPSVDQLSALLGLTLLLNKQGKHAAAVFSGEVPSTLEFLQPDETIEKNTDSLRDFIIALDKNKADKLRYKVEDNVVRIFITPFRTSITKDDFEFSQGDFNVDVVVALGVKKQEDLDEAIVSHGRILHDAAVATVNLTSEGGDLGSINWQEPSASSLSELVTRLGGELGENLLDEQIATALLTGIVAETDRFSNQKTTPETMSASATLMSAGANQQLVASKLDEKGDAGAVNLQSDSNDNDTPAPPSDGALDIEHEEPAEAVPESTDDSSDIKLPEPTIESLPSETDEDQSADSNMSSGPKLVTEPPTLGGTLTANTQQEGLDPSTDPLSLPAEEPPLLERQPEMDVPATEAQPEPSPEPEPAPATEPTEAGPSSAPPLASEPPAEVPAPFTPPAPEPSAQPEPPKPAEPSAAVSSQFTPPPPAWVPSAPDPLNLGTTDDTQAQDNQTLTEIEQAVGSPHADQSKLGDARDEVNKALTASPATPEPIQALNAQPLGKELRPEDLPTDPGPSPTAASAPADPSAPPPVPPPIPFQFGNPPAQQ